jgi:hypothetical protein
MYLLVTDIHCLVKHSGPKLCFLKISPQEGTAFSHCTTCKARFHLRVECLEDDICRRMKFRLFVARDVIAIFLVIQAVRSPFPLIALYCSLLFIVICH